jgi:hypothetical protein
MIDEAIGFVTVVLIFLYRICILRGDPEYESANSRLGGEIVTDEG